MLCHGRGSVAEKKKKKSRRKNQKKEGGYSKRGFNRSDHNSLSMKTIRKHMWEKTTNGKKEAVYLTFIRVAKSEELYATRCGDSQDKNDARKIQGRCRRRRIPENGLMKK